MTAIKTKENTVKEVITLFPERGTVVVWENRVREHEVWWEETSIRILSTSFLISSTDIKVTKETGEPGPPVPGAIHFNLNPHDSSEYILPALLGGRRPSLSVEPERERWWEKVMGLFNLKISVPCQKPIKVMKRPHPLNLSNKYYEAKLGMYQIKPLEMEKHPFWRTVEDIAIGPNRWNIEGSEEIEVNVNEVKRFICSLIRTKGTGKGYDPKIKHFLVLPRHAVYRNSEGKNVVVEGNFLKTKNPKDQKWAFGSIGRWTEEWTEESPQSPETEELVGGAKNNKDKEPQDHNSLKVMKVRTKTPPGEVHITITKVSPWTEEWSLVMIPDTVGVGHQT